MIFIGRFGNCSISFFFRTIGTSIALTFFVLLRIIVAPSSVWLHMLHVCCMLHAYGRQVDCRYSLTRHSNWCNIRLYDYTNIYT